MPRDHATSRAGGVRTTLLLGLLCAAAAAGCAPALRLPPAPGPEEIARLEAALARDSDDQDRQVELARAYQAAGRAEEARTLLEPVVEREPGHPAAVLYLGLAYEQLERFAEARSLYTRYLEVGGSRALKARLRGRLPLLERMAARAAVRALLAQEEALGGTGADPAHVAVFPFLFEGDDEEMAALSRALAELLATDLAQTDRITVLERVQTQALLEELQLGASGLVDPATAARGGRSGCGCRRRW